MIRMTYRARRAAALSVALAGVFLASCSVKDELLGPQQPGVIGPTSVGNAVGAEALRVGAVQSLSSATGGATNMWSAGGTLADEWMSGDTFFQTDDKDRRDIPNASTVSPPYQTRGYAIDALNALKTYSPTQSANIAQMYFVEGWIEMDISEHMCNGSPFGTTINGVPQYTAPLTNKQ